MRHAHEDRSEFSLIATKRRDAVKSRCNFRHISTVDARSKGFTCFQWGLASLPAQELLELALRAVASVSECRRPVRCARRPALLWACAYGAGLGMASAEDDTTSSLLVQRTTRTWDEASSPPLSSSPRGHATVANALSPHELAPVAPRSHGDAPRPSVAAAVTRPWPRELGPIARRCHEDAARPSSAAAGTRPWSRELAPVARRRCGDAPRPSTATAGTLTWPCRASAPALPSPRTVWQHARATQVPGWCGKAASHGSGSPECWSGTRGWQGSASEFCPPKRCGMAVWHGSGELGQHRRATRLCIGVPADRGSAGWPWGTAP